MKRTFILTILGATSVMFGQITPNGPWQTVANPVTLSGEHISSQTTTNGGVTNAYWNNDTFDDGAKAGYPVGTCYNIGCYITGTGAWAGAGLPGQVNPSSAPPLPLTTPVYLGNDNGTAITNFVFNGPGTAPGTQMLAEVAGADDRDWIGWYDPTKITTAADFAATGVNGRGVAWDIIFASAASPGSTSNFTPSANFGLFFFDATTNPSSSADTTGILAAIQGTGGNAGANLTQSSKNVADTAGNQHFTAFATSAAAAGTIPADFWVGVEDSPLATADKDYNDMIIHLRIVPEPGYFLLLSLGLGGLGIARRRLNRA